MVEAEQRCETDCRTTSSIEELNSSCYCLSLDEKELRNILETDLGNRGLPVSVLETHPHLFSPLPMFISHEHLKRMAEVTSVIETVISTPVFRRHAMQWAPVINHFDPVSPGGLLGYDFHLTGSRPQLIEINTNPGGALLTTVLARAQLPCCRDLDNLTMTPMTAEAIEDALFSIFMEEWDLKRTETPLTSIAIVDESPEQQYLYPEFLLYQQLFRRRGVQCVISDPGQLDRKDGRLMHDKLPIDFVYNRLTDFALNQPAHSALKQSYLESEIVLSPHPWAHALYADKRNLTLLSNETFLRQTGISDDAISILLQGIPHTEIVSDENREALWARRKQLFFKPAAGYGSKAVYRGEKLTKRVWGEIAESPYVAQALVVPSQRNVADAMLTAILKADVRNYVYKGDVKLLAARLYQGQTTNFRTPYGGFAPVFTKMD